MPEPFSHFQFPTVKVDWEQSIAMPSSSDEHRFQIDHVVTVRLLSEFLERISSVCSISPIGVWSIVLISLDRFALRGHAFDLAIGIVVGTAFSNVVKSLVDDIITPPLGLLIGGVDFVNLTVSIPNFVYRDQPPVVIRYGKFIQQVLFLFIVALALFFIVKLVAKLHRIAVRAKVEVQNVVTKELSEEVKVLHQIRDLLARKSNTDQKLRPEHWLHDK